MKIVKIELGGFPCCNNVDRYYQRVPVSFNPFNFRMEGNTRVISGVVEDNDEETTDFVLWSFLDGAELPLSGQLNYLTTVKLPDCHWHIFWSRL